MKKEAYYFVSYIADGWNYGNATFTCAETVSFWEGLFWRPVPILRDFEAQIGQKYNIKNVSVMNYQRISKRERDEAEKIRQTKQ